MAVELHHEHVAYDMTQNAVLRLEIGRIVLSIQYVGVESRAQS